MLNQFYQSQEGIRTVAVAVSRPEKEEVLSRVDTASYYKEELPSLKINSDTSMEAKALCPFHADQDPSLSVNLTTGLFHCHACGAGGDLIRFHELRRGVNFQQALADLEAFAQKSMSSHPTDGDTESASSIVTYDYVDESGTLIFQVVRTLGSEGEKRFFQQRPDGHGGWIKNLQGVTPVLYNLPEVLKADRVFIVEGEKDVQMLKAAGLVATCNPGGAGKWSEHFSAHLKGKQVIVLPDNDLPGLSHAEKVASALQGHAASVKMVKLPGLAVKGDITDWLAQGHTKEDLLVMAEAATEWVPPVKEDKPLWRLISGSDLIGKDFNVDPVIEGLLAKKEGLLMCGTSGIGKSLLTLGIALALGHPTKRSLWEQFPIPKPVKTIFFQSENADFALKSRLDRMCGIDPALRDVAKDFLVFPEINGSSRIEGKLTDDKFLNMVIEMTLEAKAGLIVLDPLISFLGVDENNNTEVRQALDRLTSVMEKTGASVLIVHHLGKQAKSTNQGGRGAQAISDWAANILVLEPADKESKDGQFLRVQHQKSRNFAVEKPLFMIERTANLLYVPSGKVKDSEAEAKVQTVVDNLEQLGGEVQKQADLKSELERVVGWSDSEAQRNIKLAVEQGLIVEFKSGGKAKGYRLTRLDSIVAPENDNTTRISQ